MDELQTPTIEISDSLVEGFGPTICNRMAILWNEINTESVYVDHSEEVKDILKASERRMHVKTYQELWANTEEVKEYNRKNSNAFYQKKLAHPRIKKTNAEILLERSEERMHMRLYEEMRRPTAEYKEYHNEYEKEYRKRPYVQEREKEYFAKPEVKKRMKETDHKHAKTETRKNYLYEYRRSEKWLEYRRGYEGEKRKTDINFLIAYRLRKSLLAAMKRYGDGKKYSSRIYGIDFKEIIEKLGKPPEDGKKYHIDHIRPCCSFDLTDPKQVKECFSPENLRWLTKEENLRKVGKDRMMSIHSSKQKTEGCT